MHSKSNPINLWHSYWPNNKEWHWTPFAILAMFYLSTSKFLSARAILVSHNKQTNILHFWAVEVKCFGIYQNIPKYPKPDSCFGYFLGCLRTTKKSIFWKAFDPSTDSKSRRVWAIWTTLRPFSPWLHVYCLWLSLPVDMRQIRLSCQLNGGLSGRHQICKNRQRIFVCFFHRLVLEQWAICLLCYLGGWGSKIFCSWCRAVAR